MGALASLFSGKSLAGKYIKFSSLEPPMNVEEIREYCIAFSDATENLQWGDDLCFKVGGRIFVTVALTAVPQKVCFKCTPETFAELIEREDIRPAPYVGRYKWVILDRLDALSNTELKELIRYSYQMVAAKARKAPLLTKNARNGALAAKLSARRSSWKKKSKKKGEHRRP
jgi:predicted DNA-binding protein (MmcQ/YjbR family)